MPDPSTSPSQPVAQKLSSFEKKKLNAARRSEMDKLTLEFKIDASRINKTQLEALHTLYREAKLYYNAVLGSYKWAISETDEGVILPLERPSWIVGRVINKRGKEVNAYNTLMDDYGNAISKADSEPALKRQSYEWQRQALKLGEKGKFNEKSQPFFNADCKVTTIPVWNSKTKNYEARELAGLPFMFREELVKLLQSDIETLSKIKKSGKKVGSLKFKKMMDCVPLKVSYTASVGTYLRDNYLKVVGLKQKFKLIKNRSLVRACKDQGLKKYSLEALLTSGQLELASSANLLRLPNKKGFVLQVLAWFPYPEKDARGPNKGLRSNRFTPEQRALLARTDVGLDAGIKNEIVLFYRESLTGDSGTMTLNTRYTDKLVKYRKRLAKLRRGLSKKMLMNQKAGRANGANVLKQRLKIQKVEADIVNAKRYYLSEIWFVLKQCRTVSFQDELIKGWHAGLFGKQIQDGILGRLYSKLRMQAADAPEQYRMVATSEPTTQYCPICGSLTKQPLANRVFKCANRCAGSEIDRDTHSAMNMLRFSGVVAKDQGPFATAGKNEMFEIISAVTAEYGPGVAKIFTDTERMFSFVDDSCVERATAMCPS